MIEISQTEKDSFRFLLKMENTAILFTSVAFDSIEEVQEIVEQLNTLGQKGLKFERKTNHAGEFLFKVKNDRGKLLGTSQPYNSEAGMENGIKNFKIRLATLSDEGLS